MEKNLVWHNHKISKKDRVKKIGQKPFLIWLTGLSGSGKSTIANALEEILYHNGNFSYVLDGDNVRHGLNKDLAFDEASRVENIRRVSEVAKLFLDAGLIVITAFISPFRSDRQLAKGLFNEDEFIEIFVDASLATCEKRDPKGFYKRAREGEIKNFTGIDSPYEKPFNPELHIKNNRSSIEEICNQIMDYLVKNDYLKLNNS